MEQKSRGWPARLILPVLCVSTVFFGVRYYQRITDDFRLAHMTYELPYHTEWDIGPLSEAEKINVLEILNQPFYYLGKGAQSYAFISEDKVHVIKFFKFKHLKPNWFEGFLPDIPFVMDYKERKALRKRRLLHSVFNGYKLAYESHREESGIVYLHLNRTKDLEKSLILYDKIGRRHKLDLDSTVFVVQRTVETTRQAMREALDRGDLALAKKRIDQIIDLFLLEYSKGIYDRDHGVIHNTGFVGDRPVHLDVGKLSKEPKMQEKAFYQPDLIKIGTRWEAWLKENYPQYNTDLLPYLEQRISNATGERFEFESR